MKALKYFTAVLLITGSLAACDGSRSNATLGGTKDTSAVAGSGSTSNGLSADSNKTDTTYKGNANPTGRGGSDSAKAQPAQ